VSLSVRWRSLLLPFMKCAICGCRASHGKYGEACLHIIREEDLSLATIVMAGLGVLAASDDEDNVEQDKNLVFCCCCSSC